MRVAQLKEIDRLEASLATLATVGSTSPYVGLFGTVWGIMSAFASLGNVRQATLAMVAPHGYPVVSGHTTLFETARGGKRHEGSLKAEQLHLLPRIAVAPNGLGAMTTVLADPAGGDPAGYNVFVTLFR